MNIKPFRGHDYSRQIAGKMLDFERNKITRMHIRLEREFQASEDKSEFTEEGFKNEGTKV